MKRILLSIIFTLAIVVGLMAAFSTTALADAGPDINSSSAAGAVYVMTNSPTTNANMVVMFNRDSHGMLTEVGPFSTEGTGSGTVRAAPPIDQLTSQGSLALTQDGKWLLAVNAGSNSITVFRVRNDGLDYVDQVGSGGTFPVSLTISGDEVFVLNQGTNSAGNVTVNPSIVGFTLGKKGDLDPNGSSYTFSNYSTYTQVGFNNDGNWLVVIDKAGGNIDVFSVNHWGMLAAAPVVNPTTVGVGPFGLTFDAKDHLLVVNAGEGSVSSYSIDRDGSLDTISGDILNQQLAACWIVSDGDNIYTANPGSPSISLYKEMDSTGKISITTADEQEVKGIPSIDMGITNNGRFLYALDPVAGEIYGFMVMPDGTLNSLLGSPFGSGLPIYAQGIAVQ
jgi:6-phosphogluconolactonase (cycloisomerase 2 family)